MRVQGEVSFESVFFLKTLKKIFNFIKLKQYRVVGRRLPSEKEQNPPLFQMKIFAPDTVQAKSRFWYFLRFLKNIKKAHGEVVSCEQVIMILDFGYLKF
jgi:hypothetical protein